MVRRRNVFRTVSLTSIVCAAFLLSPAGALAAVLFAADFEAPAYTIGALVGQNSWTGFGGSDVGDEVIANTAPGFGVAGAQTLVSAGGAAGAGWIRNFNSPVATDGTVVLDADVLPNPSKTTGLFLGSIGVGAGAYLFFDAGGAIRVWDGSGMVATGFTFDARPYHVAIRLDIDADRYDIELDGAAFLSGLDARLTPGVVNPVEVVELFSADGTAGDLAYIDNILVQHDAPGLPEPGTLALLLGAGLVAGGLRRRPGSTKLSR